MVVNPEKDRQSETNRQRRRASFSMSTARVTSVPEDNTHKVIVQEQTDVGNEGETSPIAVDVLVDQQGDINLPSVGDLVILGRLPNRRPVVVGKVYANKDDIRTFVNEDRDERHIGTDDDSAVYLHGDYARVPTPFFDPEGDIPDGSLWYASIDDDIRLQRDGSVENLATLKDIVPTVNGDLSNPDNGDIWYNSDTDEFRGQRGGTTITLISEQDMEDRFNQHINNYH